MNQQILVAGGFVKVPAYYVQCWSTKVFYRRGQGGVDRFTFRHSDASVFSSYEAAQEKSEALTLARGERWQVVNESWLIRQPDLPL